MLRSSGLVGRVLITKFVCVAAWHHRQEIGRGNRKGQTGRKLCWCSFVLCAVEFDGEARDYSEASWIATTRGKPSECETQDTNETAAPTATGICWGEDADIGLNATWWWVSLILWLTWTPLYFVKILISEIFLCGQALLWYHQTKCGRTQWWWMVPLETQDQMHLPPRIRLLHRMLPSHEENLSFDGSVDTDWRFYFTI